MPANFNRPHLDISSRLIARAYQAPQEFKGGGSAPRIRDAHAQLLQAQLSEAFLTRDATAPVDPRIDPPTGIYLEVEVRRGEKPEGVLERKRDGVKVGATKQSPDQNTLVALFLPNDARPVLERILEDYRTGPLVGAKQSPPNKDRVEPIEAIRLARLETFWTDDVDALPDDPQDVIWWEVWCHKGMEAQLDTIVQKLGARAADADHRLFFPETTVIPVLATRATIELMLFATAGIAELRRATTTPSIFLEAGKQEQLEWTDDLAERTVWPGRESPAVCILDTGVNRAHALIEPALAPAHTIAVIEEWGGNDDGGGHVGHGTAMAGLALHGDLVHALQKAGSIELLHRLESVKILPPPGQPSTDPKSYGSNTQSAISRIEIVEPDGKRAFCMAVTNDSVAGSKPTTWSAAVDQIAAGAMPGDEEDAPRRLIFVSAGNAPPVMNMADLLDADQHPIEDPAQAWNAITVGAYTDKIVVDDAGYDDWTPLASAGDLSPFTRTSTLWPSRMPIKPEIVMEGGNRGVSPSGIELLSLESLGLLTTGPNVGAHPLVPFSATSAATAQASRLAAQLMALHPDYWPETIRALIIHSAEWTDVMLATIQNAPNKTARCALLRRFGYGVPDFDRASMSASNHVALVTQNTIKPFKLAKGDRRFRDCHFYRLPWPTELLERLGAQDVRLKITLSYYIAPNPGMSASIDPQRYQSYGLRFDLRRPLETMTQFVERVNPLERENPRQRVPVVQDDQHWRFGPSNISAGSLHCDEWVGPAAQLAARNIICVKPVMGWWRSRGSAAECNAEARYALTATISTPDLDIDLHTPISTLIENSVDIEIEF